MLSRVELCREVCTHPSAVVFSVLQLTRLDKFSTMFSLRFVDQIRVVRIQYTVPRRRVSTVELRLVGGVYSVSQKSPCFFWHFLPNFWESLVQILYAYYAFLSTLEYEFLFNYLQLWRSYAILSATTIMCSKCLPSTEKHAGLSHLIWHNFVTVGDNWIKNLYSSVDRNV